MEDRKSEALEWIGSYRNFPQLYSIGKLGFPIGRSTTSPIEDDWSINATGYRGNSRVKQIARDPHLEVLWIDTRGPWNKAVRIRGLGYHTNNETLLRVYNEREDKARARGEGFGERLHGKAITDTVACTHITPQRVTLEGFDGPDSIYGWEVDPAGLRPPPPRADGSEPLEGPIGFRQPWEMTIAEVSAQALSWARSQSRRQHLYTVQDGFPTGQPAALHAGDDWSVDVLVGAGDAALKAVAGNPRVEVSWIDASHDAAKNMIPTIVFLRGMATLLGSADAAEALRAWRLRDEARTSGVGQSLPSKPDSANVRVLRVRPTRLRTEGFGKGLQLYAWNP